MQIGGFSLGKQGVLVALVLTACVASMPKTALADPLADAMQTTDSLIGGLAAAVLSVTAATMDPEDVAPNSEAISLLLPRSAAYRLLDDTGEPLNRTNKARGAWERAALEAAVMTKLPQQEVVGNKLRTVFPLGNNQGCVPCHANYGDLPDDAIVGAISTKVRLPRD